MSRSGYSTDLDNWDLIRWRGQVASAIRGKRGQRLLKELLSALDAMPEKRLIAEELVNSQGAVCALGCLGKAKGFDMTGVDPDDRDQVSNLFDIASPLACEIVFQNDEGDGWRGRESAEDRFNRVRRWVVEHIK